MGRYIILAVVLIGLGVRGPELLQFALEYKGNNTSVTEQDAAPSPVFKRNQASLRKNFKTSYNPLANRSVRARMNSNGHFFFSSKMNGVPVRVMVDTGATGVAINRSTARRLGIRLTNSDFKYKSNTANGIAYYASAMIDEIQIGRVIVHDVRAAVLKDSSLNGTLLGMTFLRKLRKFEINRETLILTQ